MARTDAIIVSAGVGSRFGGEIPKQYVHVLGRQIIDWTIDAFLQAEEIDRIILVVSGAYREQFEVNPHVDCVVTGGATRMESVLNGINASSADFVAVHDGARPLVMSERIYAVARVAYAKDAAILAHAVNETVKRVQDNVIVDTPNRAELYLARTPQVFCRQLLKKALESLPAGLIPTDDAQAVELLGTQVHIVQDSPDNIKITYPQDVFLAERVLSMRIG